MPTSLLIRTINTIDMMVLRMRLALVIFEQCFAL